MSRARCVAPPATLNPRRSSPEAAVNLCWRLRPIALAGNDLEDSLIIVSAIREKHGWTAQPLERCGFDSAFPLLGTRSAKMGRCVKAATLQGLRLIWLKR